MPYALCALVVLVLGIWLRVSPAFAGALGAGYDERLYIRFLTVLQQTGSYPELCRTYLVDEASVPDKRVSPMRSVFLLHAYGWSAVRPSAEPFKTLNDVCLQASCVMLLVCGLFGRRLGGDIGGLAMLSMMAVAPLQVFNAHRALTDGYFSLWVVLMMWALWECLERPDQLWPAWLLGLSWIPLLMAKEAALFVWLGALTATLLVRSRKGARSAGRIWLAHLLGPAAGLLLQVVLCGGPETFWALLSMVLRKPASAFTVVHCDGPWWGYGLALVLLSPAVTLLCGAAILGPPQKSRDGLFAICFLLMPLAVLACLPSIVPRILTLVDFPLRWLCWLQVCELTAQTGRPLVWRTAALVGLCLLEFEQFYHYFQRSGIYEPTCDVLLWSLKVVPTL